jgi:hypothetical protein
MLFDDIQEGKIYYRVRPTGDIIFITVTKKQGNTAYIDFTSASPSYIHYMKEVIDSNTWNDDKHEVYSHTNLCPEELYNIVITKLLLLDTLEVDDKEKNDFSQYYKE